MTTRDMRNITVLPTGKYRVRIKHDGEPLDGVVATYDEAVDLRDELKRRIVDGELMPVRGKTTRDLRGPFLGSRNGNRSADDDASRWNHIASAPWSRKAIAAVTKSDGRAWLKALKRTRCRFDPEKHGDRPVKFLGWQSRKHCLNLARSFFDWAIAEECYGVTDNPFTGLVVEREDGDEDEGYQEGWYLDRDDQPRFLGTWDRKDIGLDEGDRMEKWLAAFAIGSGLRKGEQWCLHLTDVFVGRNEPSPRVVVRFGSWDPVKKRYRAPKGRKGEKKTRVVYLHGLALEAARVWLALLPVYAPNNPLGLMFPTERGARRVGMPRSWKKVVGAFGVIPRIGRKVWWHLLRHTCASSMISGWWGMRWRIESVSKVLGHTDVRTTQIYAHLAPDALEEDAVKAQRAYAGSCHGLVTAQRPAARHQGFYGRTRPDSNRGHSASKAVELLRIVDRSAPHDNAVTSICHVLGLIADGEAEAPDAVIDWLAQQLDVALTRCGVANDSRRSG